MLESPFRSSAPSTVQVSAALATVPNLLLSLWALTADDVAVEPWIAQAAAQLSPEQRHFNRLLFAAFGGALLPGEPPADFPSYLAALAAEDAAAFQSRLDAAAQQTADPAWQAAAKALLTNAPALREQVLDHLNTLWTTLLAPEWQRHTHLLTKTTRSINELIFSQPQWQAANPFHALRYLMQTEPQDSQVALLAGVEQIVLVWSPHLTAHCTRLGSRSTLWVVRKFDPQLLRRDPLRRAEVLGPLNTLADETRLRILELLVEQGELRAQEIIAQLEGSQGNVSRHLKQLLGAGFVRERRAGDANKLYTYEPPGCSDWSCRRAAQEQRVMDFTRAVGGKHHHRRGRRANGANFGYGDLKIGEHLQQECLELLVGAVEFVDQQHRRLAVVAFQRLQQRPLEEIVRAEEVMLGAGNIHRARRLQQADLQHLARIIPLVDRAADVQPLITLQPDQARVEQAGQHLGDLGLADAGLTLQKERAAQLERQEDGGGEAALAEVAVVGERSLESVNGVEERRSHELSIVDCQLLIVHAWPCAD